MTMLLGPVRISGEDLAELVTNFRIWKQMPWDELRNFLGYAPNQRTRCENSANKRTQYTLEEQNRIREKIENSMSVDDWQRLRVDLPHVYKKAVSVDRPIANVFHGLLGLSNENHEFNQMCTGRENGRYLIIRKGMNSDFFVSYMQIKPASAKTPLPTFFTYRPPSNGRPRGVKGVIFQSGSLVYSVGRSTISTGFRASILERLPREGERNDLVGVRLGIQENPDAPFSYPIYCYQLVRSRLRATRRKITGEINKETLRQEGGVRNIDFIETALDSAAKQTRGTFFERQV